MSTPTTELAKRSPAQELIQSHVEQIAMALPKHITKERMARVMITALTKTPKLMECTKISLLASIMDCASLGLEPNDPLGRAYLIPYKMGDTVVCQLQIGYRGLVDLAYRSGKVDSLDVFVVHANDDFNMELGLNPKINHVPLLDDPGDPVGFYAVAHLKECTRPKFCFMSSLEVDAIRDRSQGYKSALKYEKDHPWISSYEEMGKKTVLKRMSKLLPLSPEFHQAVAVDNEHEVRVVTEAVLDAPMAPTFDPPALKGPPEAPKAPAKPAAAAPAATPPPAQAPAAKAAPAAAPAPKTEAKPRTIDIPGAAAPAAEPAPASAPAAEPEPAPKAGDVPMKDPYDVSNLGPKMTAIKAIADKVGLSMKDVTRYLREYSDVQDPERELMDRYMDSIQGDAGNSKFKSAVTNYCAKKQ